MSKKETKKEREEMEREEQQEMQYQDDIRELMWIMHGPLSARKFLNAIREFEKAMQKYESAIDCRKLRTELEKILALYSTLADAKSQINCPWKRTISKEDAAQYDIRTNDKGEIQT